MSARKPLLESVFRQRLLSTYDKKLFTHCADCDVEVLKSGRPFIVTKDYNYGEVVMEYAICMRCNDKHQASWSEGSRNKVSKLYRDAAGSQLDWEPIDSSAGIEGRKEGPFDHCWVTGGEIPLDQPFQIVTMVQITERKVQPSSILLSYLGLERIQSVLSKQTRDERDRFRERIYPRVPPEWEDPPVILDPEILHVGPSSSKGSY